MAGELYISNLAGTFDYQEILALYYQSQIAPVQLLQQQEAELSEKASALEEFQSLIDNFYDAFNSLTSTTLLEEKSVEVSSPEVLQATVIDPLEAVEGSYQVTVSQLAANDVWLSQGGVADLTSAVATTAGQITIEYGGEVVATVDYDADASDSTYPSTLKEIADAINSSQSSVTASVVYDGQNYRLLLSGADTGASSTISIYEAGDGDLLDVLQLGSSYPDSHVQTAQDAQIELYGTAVTSPTNTFKDALPGVEITINSLGTSTVTVKSDYTPFKEALSSLISAYNSIVDFINQKGGKDGVLSGESTLYSVRGGLLSRLQSLFNLGLLDVDKDSGRLSIDEGKLTELLESSPQSLEDAVTQLKDSLQDYLLFLISPDGPVEARIEAIDKSKEQIEDRIDFMNKMINEQVEMLKQQLIQVQLLQAQMEELRAKIAATFGTQVITQTG